MFLNEDHVYGPSGEIYDEFVNMCGDGSKSNGNTYYLSDLEYKIPRKDISQVLISNTISKGNSDFSEMKHKMNSTEDEISTVTIQWKTHPKSY